MTLNSRRLLAGSLVLAVVAVGGCKAKPAEDSGFLANSAVMTENEQFPFDRAWFAPGWNSSALNSIVVAPVDTSYVKKATWFQEANLKGDGEQMGKDLQNLAVFTQDKFRAAFENDKEQRFRVVNSPQAGSVVMELALVEVVPNKAALGALGLAATIVAAPLGVAIAAKETGKGAVAIEGRIKDAQTGEVIGMFADREAGKFAPINVRRATWYGEAHKVIQEWAAQWVKIANAPPGEKVKDTKSFTLRPW